LSASALFSKADGSACFLRLSSLRSLVSAIFSRISGISFSISSISFSREYELSSASTEKNGQVSF
jgi:hypothetical protein